MRSIGRTNALNLVVRRVPKVLGNGPSPTPCLWRSLRRCLFITAVSRAAIKERICEEDNFGLIGSGEIRLFQVERGATHYGS